MRQISILKIILQYIEEKDLSIHSFYNILNVFLPYIDSGKMDIMKQTPTIFKSINPINSYNNIFKLPNGVKEVRTLGTIGKESKLKKFVFDPTIDTNVFYDDTENFNEIKVAPTATSGNAFSLNFNGENNTTFFPFFLLGFGLNLGLSGIGGYGGLYWYNTDNTHRYNIDYNNGIIKVDGGLLDNVVIEYRAYSYDDAELITIEENLSYLSKLYISMQIAFNNMNSGMPNMFYQYRDTYNFAKQQFEIEQNRILNEKTILPDISNILVERRNNNNR